MNNTEALTGFIAWLTTREEKTILGAESDAAPIAELLKQFCEANNLPPVSEEWPGNFVFPRENWR